VISFLLAATVTWALNRRFAFGDRQPLEGQTSRQYFQYLGAQSLGSLANMAVYAFLLWQCPRLQAMVVVPLGIGAVVGALMNYLLLDRWVFKRKAQQLPTR
jgi:putative flippase GtrA